MFKRYVIAAICSIVVGVSISGCQPDSEFTGKGPLTLNSQQASAFEEWKGGVRGDPLYFYIRSDGSVYYVWCTGASLALCKDSSPRQSWEECESSKPGTTCRLYGESGGIVWNFDSPADPRTDMETAITSGNSELVRSLLSQGTDPNELITYQNANFAGGKKITTTPLIAAVVLNDRLVTRILLESGIDLKDNGANPKWHRNAFAICPATNSPRKDILLDLIAAGINVNPTFKCIRDRTPLESAVARGYHETASILRNAGAKNSRP